MKKLLALVAALILPLFLSTCAYVVQPPPPDYLAIMTQAALIGDIPGGREAESARNQLIDESGSDEVKVSFDDLFLLSKFIYVQAGKRWHTDELRMCVGEVVLNRLDSPEYPNSLEAVITQPGMYPLACTQEFQEDTLPSKDSVSAAMRLLLGERMLAPQVVIQSEHIQGQVYSSFCDKMSGNTYFCESPYPGLYTSHSDWSIFGGAPDSVKELPRLYKSIH